MVFDMDIIERCVGFYKGIQSAGVVAWQVHRYQKQELISLETNIDDVSDVTAKLSTVRLEKVVASPTLKLPHLFSSSPNSSGKGANVQKRYGSVSQANQVDNVSEVTSTDQPSSNNHVDNPPQARDTSYVQNLRRSVREAALQVQPCSMESARDTHSFDSSKPFFIPLSGTGFSHSPETKSIPVRSKRLFGSPPNSNWLTNTAFDVPDEEPDTTNDMDLIHKYGIHPNGLHSGTRSKYPATDTLQAFHDLEDQVFSPPLLMDTSLLEDSYEDLLAPLSETDTALMER